MNELTISWIGVVLLTWIGMELALGWYFQLSGTTGYLLFVYPVIGLVLLVGLLWGMDSVSIMGGIGVAVCLPVLLRAIEWIRIWKDHQTKQWMRKGKRVIGLYANQYAINLSEEDIRFSVRSKKQAVFVLTFYQGEDVVLFKAIEKGMRNRVKAEFPGWKIQLVADFQRSKLKTAVTADRT